MNRHSFDFFPLNCALSLQRRREDDSEHRMETLMAQVQMLVDKVKSEVSRDYDAVFSGVAVLRT